MQFNSFLAIKLNRMKIKIFNLIIKLKINNLYTGLFPFEYLIPGAGKGSITKIKIFKKNRISKRLNSYFNF